MRDGDGTLKFKGAIRMAAAGGAGRAGGGSLGKVVEIGHVVKVSQGAGPASSVRAAMPSTRLTPSGGMMKVSTRSGGGVAKAPTAAGRMVTGSGKVTTKRTR